MINVRYHIYSLVAVFLALAIGVAAGSTVVQRAVVDNLRSNQDRIEKNLDSLEAENSDLQARTAALEKRSGSLSDAGPAALLEGELDETPVVLIHAEGVDGDTLDRVRNTLGASGASIIGDIELKAAAADPDTLAGVADVLDLPGDQRQPEDVQAAIGERLGAAIGLATDAAAERAGEVAHAPIATDTGPVTTDPEPTPEAQELRALADSLDDAGVLSVRGSIGKEADTSEHPPDLVVLGGLTTALDPVPILRPLLQALAETDRPGALAADADLASPPGDGEKATGIVSAVRDTGQLRDHIATVDSLDDFAGLAAMVLGLAALSGGDVGHYGSGEGADALLPSRRP
jgi:hypothetical protein